MKILFSFVFFLCLTSLQKSDQESDNATSILKEQTAFFANSNRTSFDSLKVTTTSTQQAYNSTNSTETSTVKAGKGTKSMESETKYLEADLVENSNQEITNSQNILQGFNNFPTVAILLSFIGYFLYSRKKIKKTNEEKNQIYLKFLNLKERNQKLQNSRNTQIAQNQTLQVENGKLLDELAASTNQSAGISKVLEQKIVLPGKQKTLLKIGDILYVQSQKNAISIVTNNEPIWVWETLMKFKTSLPDSEFCRAHRSYLVNLNEVVSFNKKSVTLSNNKEIKIGQVYSADLLEKLKGRASNS